MKFVNGWNYVQKDANRFHFGMRIGIVTVFELYYDVSDADWRVTIFNYGIGAN